MQTVDVNFTAKEAHVTMAKGTSTDTLLAALKKAGYEGTVKSPAP